jgi:hypothetical protein
MITGLGKTRPTVGQNPCASLTKVPINTDCRFPGQDLNIVPYECEAGIENMTEKMIMRTTDRYVYTVVYYLIV